MSAYDVHKCLEVTSKSNLTEFQIGSAVVSCTIAVSTTICQAFFCTLNLDFEFCMPIDRLFFFPHMSVLF